MAGLVLRVKEIRREAAETKVFVFAPEADAPLHYDAGQYLTLLVQIGARELRRPYSLISAPSLHEDPAIAVKLIDNGEVSRYLHRHLQVGDRLPALAPNGRFTVNKSSYPRDLFLFAAGSGIAPVIAILKETLHTDKLTHVKLIYSNHNIETCIFYEELRALELQFAEQLEIVWLFSNNRDLTRARLNTYLVKELTASLMRYRREQALFYICGPYEYMDTAIITLLSVGFAQEQIKKETFNIPEPEGDEDADEELLKKAYTDRFIGLTYKGHRHRIGVQAGDTVLEAALKQGIELPYSCRSGMCSTCTARLKQGQVYMHYNEVLTNEEISRGAMLTCTAHPESDDVEIQL